MVAFASLLLLSACPGRTAVWVIDGSTASHLEFGIANRRNGGRPVKVGVLRVGYCHAPDYGADGAVWIIGEDSLREPLVTRVTYGQAPLGYRSAVGPEPLRPGCYSVTVSGMGRVRFEVDSSGSVREVPGSGESPS